MKRTEEFGLNLALFICLVVPVLGWIYGWVRLFSMMGWPITQAASPGSFPRYRGWIGCRMSCYSFER
jgi:hypothetical protein